MFFHVLPKQLQILLQKLLLLPVRYKSVVNRKFVIKQQGDKMKIFRPKNPCVFLRRTSPLTVNV